MIGTPDELTVVSNRLPVEVHRTSDGLQVSEGPGGLASTLSTLLERSEGTWVGWPGCAGPVDEEEIQRETDVPYRVVPVPLSEEEIDRYYRGFANEILWPLFHDLYPYCEFEPRFFEAYRSINARFAEATLDAAGGGPIWVHDYHLMLAGRELSEAGADQPLGFFLHIPFPQPDLLERLPWHQEILSALTSFDLLGFQTSHDLDNFRETVARLDPGAEIRVEDGLLHVEVDGRSVRASTFPISIDFDEIQTRARSPGVQDRVDLAHLPGGREDHTYIVGVERLDYTKGITERLRAFDTALDRFPEMRGDVTLLQHVNPSREGIDQYQKLRGRVERAVGRINGEHGTLDWIPIRFSMGHRDFEEILAMYRLADVALVTPLRDGMNLVAKEYCAAKTEGDGVLVLSPFAGAAEELGDHAVLVNPHDVDEMARAIHRACTMPAEQRQQRMVALRKHIATHDVDRWAESLLEALAGASEAISAVGTAET